MRASSTDSWQLSQWIESYGVIKYMVPALPKILKSAGFFMVRDRLTENISQSSRKCSHSVADGGALPPLSSGPFSSSPHEISDNERYLGALSGESNRLQFKVNEYSVKKE